MILNPVSDRFLRNSFYVSWILLALVQAALTELLGDEAYYWRYAQDLSWGYFDHPPALAWAIRLGTELLPGELGVRFFPALLVAGAVYAMERTIRPPDLKLYYILVASVALFHFFSFVALPDAPFLFFASLFLWAYRSFLEHPTVPLSIGLGLAGGAMILSKYHAFLFIGLLVLFHLSLLRSRYFWLAAGCAFLLLLPHLYWLWEHDFPAFRYHLFERSVKGYTLWNTVQYLLTTAFVLGPFTGILFLVAAWKFPVRDRFERSLKGLFWAGLVFFFFMTFKGRVESHWTLFCVLPAWYFTSHWVLRQDRWRTWTVRLFPYTLGLILMVRLALAIDLLPEASWNREFKMNFHQRAQWAALVAKEIGPTPVLFMNSYREAALYEFYSGHPSMALNNISGRKNQYDLWNLEDAFRGEEVAVVLNYPLWGFDSIPGIQPKTIYRRIANFQSYSRVRLTPLQVPPKVQPGQELLIHLNAQDLGRGEMSFQANPDFPSCINYQFFAGNQMVEDWTTAAPLEQDLFSRPYPIMITSPQEPGTYGLHFSIQTGWLPPTINSGRYAIEVLPSEEQP